MAKKTCQKFIGGAEAANRRIPAMPKNIRDEPDMEWKRWFINIEERRRAQKDPKQKAIIVSFPQKDGEQGKPIIRRQSSPLPLGDLLKIGKKKRGENLSADLALIETVWRKTIGEEMARETEIYSFNRGVLTITVRSSTLLQEFRQFYKEALITDLRDIWAASIPLTAIKYRLGKLDGRRY